MKLHPGLIFIGYLVLAERKKHAPTSEASHPMDKPAVPKVYAYLYQLPEDAFTTTRMSFGEHGQTPQEMGIFQSPESARKVASQKGWLLAWDGVKQLQTRPGE